MKKKNQIENFEVHHTSRTGDLEMREEASDLKMDRVSKKRLSQRYRSTRKATCIGVTLPLPMRSAALDLFDLTIFSDLRFENPKNDCEVKREDGQKSGKREKKMIRRSKKEREIFEPLELV